MPRKPRIWQFRFTDMLEACRRIILYSARHSGESLAQDQKSLDALVRCFAILGEAANHVPKEIQAQYPSLPWREMTAMRNELSHGYFDLSPEVLLATALRNIPPLFAELERIVGQLPPASTP